MMQRAKGATLPEIMERPPAGSRTCAGLRQHPGQQRRRKCHEAEAIFNPCVPTASTPDALLVSATQGLRGARSGSPTHYFA
jgi:hypothetical protein